MKGAAFNTVTQCETSLKTLNIRQLERKTGRVICKTFLVKLNSKIEGKMPTQTYVVGDTVTEVTLEATVVG